MRLRNAAHGLTAVGSSSEEIGSVISSSFENWSSGLIASIYPRTLCASQSRPSIPAENDESGAAALTEPLFL
jgi:hypothetical protein